MSEASVTDIPAGSAPTTTDVLASQLQLIQAYLLVRCNSFVLLEHLAMLLTSTLAINY